MVLEFCGACVAGFSRMIWIWGTDCVTHSCSVSFMVIETMSKLRKWLRARNNWTFLTCIFGLLLTQLEREPDDRGCCTVFQFDLSAGTVMMRGIQTAPTVLLDTMQREGWSNYWAYPTLQKFNIIMYWLYACSKIPILWTKLREHILFTYWISASRESCLFCLWDADSCSSSFLCKQFLN